MPSDFAPMSIKISFGSIRTIVPGTISPYLSLRNPNSFSLSSLIETCFSLTAPAFFLGFASWGLDCPPIETIFSPDTVFCEHRLAYGIRFAILL